jgi:type II secretory pathway component PulC
MDKQTSDERLLKLIEDSSDPKHRETIVPGSKKPSVGLKPAKFNLALLKTTFKGLKTNLVNLNKGLISFASLLTLVFFYTLFSGPTVSKSNAAYLTPADAAAVAKAIASGEEQGLARKNILNLEIKRNIFLASGRKSSYSENTGPDLTEVVKDLKLVGIIWSANPEVMIENAKDSRTYTLKKGESFNNGQFKVKEISRNSAVLEVTTETGSGEYEIR